MSEATRRFRSMRVGIGRFLFKYRDYLFPAVFLCMVLFTRPRLPFGSWEGQKLIEIAGVLIAVAGQTLRVLVIGFAYIRRAGVKKEIYAPALVREGMFALSRNPLYMGNMAIVAGLCMIYDAPLAYLIVLPVFFFSYLCIVEAEEEHLRARFREAYDKYCAEVNRFVPSLRGYEKAFEGMSFDIKRVISKDYGTAFYWFAGALLLDMREDIFNFGFMAVRQEIFVQAVVLILGIGAWGVARYLKKTHRLATPEYMPPDAT